MFTANMSQSTSRMLRRKLRVVPTGRIHCRASRSCPSQVQAARGTPGAKACVAALPGDLTSKYPASRHQYMACVSRGMHRRLPKRRPHLCGTSMRRDRSAPASTSLRVNTPRRRGRSARAAVAGAAGADGAARPPRTRAPCHAFVASGPRPRSPGRNTGASVAADGCAGADSAAGAGWSTGAAAEVRQKLAM